MKNLILLLVLSVVILNPVKAQKKPITIKANSTLVDIREDKMLFQKVWTISPEIKPDVYQTNAKKVTFYTDIDSITAAINPKDSVFTFVILLNGKDSAVTQIKYRESKLSILKTAAKYDNTDKSYIPNFTYQSSDNPNLVTLRKELKLDSIAGEGNEISKILNLMHWLHDLIPHDGINDNPEVKNALNMISVCKKEGRGLNCRGLAMVLNECYLSLGIKSRYITCLPKDTTDQECHVINMVYSNDLNKWIWIDPSFDAYVMNEKGELLGIEEVRKRLINGETLILSPDANWNRKQSITKEFYLENYMAKNLYKLETPLVSEYNTETPEKGKVIKYIQLISSVDIPVKTSSETYFTRNPTLFWIKPE
ncbi:MAG: transglutaminase-like domain-containing protein [Chitinophagaceae bacterium]